MAVTVNGAAATNTTGINTATGVYYTFSYTCPVATSCLALIEAGVTISGGVGTVPTALTYGSDPMFQVPGASSQGLNGAEISMWYLMNPRIGVNTISLQWSEGRTIQELLVVPLLGVGSVGPGTAGLSGNADPFAWAVQDGGVNDLYIAAMQASMGSGTYTPTGVGQTKLAQVTARGSFTASVDTIAANNAGQFGWTTAGAGSQGVAVAAVFYAPVSGAGELTQVDPPNIRRRRPAGLAMDETPLQWW